MKTFSEYINEKAKKTKPTDKELEEILKKADRYSGYSTFVSLIQRNNRDFDLSGKDIGDKMKEYWEKNINKGHFKPGDEGYLK